jgi:hypothetical protein
MIARIAYFDNVTPEQRAARESISASSSSPPSPPRTAILPVIFRHHPAAVAALATALSPCSCSSPALIFVKISKRPRGTWERGDESPHLHSPLTDDERKQFKAG